MSDHAAIVREIADSALRRPLNAESHITLVAALDALVAERDSWRTLAEGWKLTDDVRKSSDQRRTDRSHSTE